MRIRIGTIFNRFKSPLTLGLLIDHAKAVRVPLLIIGLGVVLTFWVDQIHELFLLLMTDSKVLNDGGALLTAGLLGFAVWHTARTVFRFNIVSVPALADPRASGLRKIAPRLLGALVPVLMAVGCWSALFDPALKNHAEKANQSMPVLFLGEAALLLGIVITRRRLFRRNGLAADPSGDPRVARWSQLPRMVLVTYRSIFAANLFALILARFVPGSISVLGPLSVVLLCATFLTVSGTYLTIQAARWQFPLLSALLGAAVLWQLMDLTDNHRVRLYEGMHSYSTARAASIDDAAPIAGSFVDHVAKWRKGIGPSDAVYIVSAEGGGIRASAWTALVLTELERESDGAFSRHMLLGSGVSGGSLGLALFAAMVKGERDQVISRNDLSAITRDFNQADFLGPTLETMFLTDFLQRFIPSAVMVDRGERLESQWERSWQLACEQRPSRINSAHPLAVEPICTTFSKPWKELWSKGNGIPVLFLNSTEVITGQRFIEQPFEHIESNETDATFWSASTLSNGILPASSPLSAVVHNSARFTYVSPAGTLYDPSDKLSPKRQLVDGGYFENSGTTTLAQLAEILANSFPECSGAHNLGSAECPVRLIHISNDVSVESLRPDAEDSCSSDARSPAPAYGEIRAPVLALVHTRDARAALARAAARNLFVEGRVLTPPAASKFAYPNIAGSASPNGAHDEIRFYHFRLCAGNHHLPLGWNLSAQAMEEMISQLHSRGRGNQKQFDTLLAQLRVATLASPRMEN